MNHPVTDITIAGAGPAGLALAAALADRGVDVMVVDPTPSLESARWHNRYGAWLDELQELAVHVEASWDAPYVDFGQGPRVLPTPYAWVDRARTRAGLVQRILDRGGRLQSGRVVQVEKHPSGSDALLEHGGRIKSRCVIDATGSGVLAGRPGEPAAWQVAYGQVVRAEHPCAPGSAAYMDFSASHLPPSERASAPSFLYALPLDADHIFVEETSLVARPAMSMQVLQRRLQLRLAALDVHPTEVLETERCVIPMDAAPVLSGPVPAIGAGAGWVHPATGYSLVRAFRMASPVADAIVEGLGHAPAEALRRTWDAIWPDPQLRTRALHDLGLGLLLGMDSAQISRFFDAFFSIPVQGWRAYLDATSPPGAVAGSMTRVFAALPRSMRTIVLRHALGQGRADLLRVITPRPLGGAS